MHQNELQTELRKCLERNDSFIICMMRGKTMSDRKVIPIIYVVLIYLSLATTLQNIYNVTYYSKYYIGIGLTVFFFLVYMYRKKNWFPLNKKELILAVMFVMPVLVAYLYSIALDFLWPVEYAGYDTRALSGLVFHLIVVVQAYFTHVILKERAVIYTFVAVALNYFTSIIVAFSKDGLTQFVALISDTGYVGSVLEMHEVAPIISLFLFYFWYQFRFEKFSVKKTIVRLSICFIIMFCSMKRIVFLSSFITLFMFELLRYVYVRRTKVITIPVRFVIRAMGFVMLFVMFAFVLFIESGLLYEFLRIFNINSMARAEFWKGISSEYSFSLLFLGRGMGFVSKWMDNNWMNLGVPGMVQSTGIHSDVLKYYIELGFCGFFLYFYYYLIVLTKKIDKVLGLSKSILYFVLMFVQFLVYFTDNISAYHNYQWIMYLIFFSLVGTENDNAEKKGVYEKNN